MSLLTWNSSAARTKHGEPPNIHDKANVVADLALPFLSDLPAGGDVFAFGIFENSLVAAFTSESALLDAPKRAGGV